MWFTNIALRGVLHFRNESLSRHGSVPIPTDIDQAQNRYAQRGIRFAGGLLVAELPRPANLL